MYRSKVLTWREILWGDVEDAVVRGFRDAAIWSLWRARCSVVFGDNQGSPELFFVSTFSQVVSTLFVFNYLG